MPEPSKGTPDRIRGDGGLGEAVEKAVTRYFVWQNQWSDPETGSYDGGEVEFVTEMFEAMLEASDLPARLAAAEQRAEEAEREKAEAWTEEALTHAEFAQKIEAAERQVEALREAIAPELDRIDRPDGKQAMGWEVVYAARQIRAALAQQGETP